MRVDSRELPLSAIPLRQLLPFILGLPGPRFPSTCMLKAVLTAPLEHSTCPYHWSLLSFRMRYRSSMPSRPSSSLDLVVTMSCCLALPPRLWQPLPWRWGGNYDIGQPHIPTLMLSVTAGCSFMSYPGLSCWIIELATPISDYQPIRLHHIMFSFKFTNWMTNSVDPDQMASSEAIWSGSTLFANVGVVVNSRIKVKEIEVVVVFFPYFRIHIYSSKNEKNSSPTNHSLFERVG